MNRERLEKLAEHLESGELGHERFDFSTWNSGGSPRCGTAGCAIGECPIIWPDDWKFCTMGYPSLRDPEDIIPTSAAMDWFDLDEAEEDHLFHAWHQDPERFGGQDLGIKATRYEVAANIRAFIARKLEEQP